MGKPFVYLLSRPGNSCPAEIIWGRRFDNNVENACLFRHLLQEAYENTWLADGSAQLDHAVLPEIDEGRPFFLIWHNVCSSNLKSKTGTTVFTEPMTPANGEKQSDRRMTFRVRHFFNDERSIRGRHIKRRSHGPGG